MLCAHHELEERVGQVVGKGVRVVVALCEEN
jgi:hypothetical protein